MSEDSKIKNGKREDDPARDIDIQDIQRKQLHVILSRQELERIYNDYGNPSTRQRATGSKRPRLRQSGTRRSWSWSCSKA